jgi:hypothetical protein
MLATIMLISYITTFAQKQAQYLGMTEQLVVKLLSENENLNFEKRGTSTDSLTYMAYKAVDNSRFISTVYYFDKSSLCVFIRVIYKNEYLSPMLREIRSLKSYKSAGDYAWVNTEKSHSVEFQFKDNDPVFCVVFRPFKNK